MMQTKPLDSALIKSKLSNVTMPKSWCADLNACTTAGIYSVKDGTANTPTGDNMFGTLVVMVSEYFHSQTIYTTTDGNFSRVFIIDNGVPLFYNWYSFGTKLS